MNEQERGPASKQKPRTAQKRTTTTVTREAASVTVPPGAMVVSLSTPDSYTIVDAEDFEFLSRFRWSAPGGRYAVARVDGHSILMHRLIVGATPGMEVDHVNRNGLDNRKCNLRHCDRFQNTCNRGPTKRNTSGFKGVHWRKDNLKWRAQIKVGGKMHHLGDHLVVEDAARAYDHAARRYFGDFAWTNFPAVAS